MKETSQEEDGQSSGGFLANACVFLATGALLGLVAPFAPGTFGTLWGLLLAWGVHLIPYFSIQIFIIALVFAVGIPICTLAAEKLGKKDPGSIVWDEIAAVPITVLFVPSEAWQPWVMILGFCLFRFFDIVKPPPTKSLAHLPRGLGVMADDTMAGVYSCLTLHLALWLVKTWL